MPFVIEPHGRQGIGVAQPQAGTDFPLLLPSADVRYLLADLQLTFDQPSDYADLPAFTSPFRIYWLSGFGEGDPGFQIPTLGDSSSWSSVCVSHSSSVSGGSLTTIDCLPLPKHGHDIIIVDADDHVVFDSTHPLVTYSTRTWGTRLRVITWKHPTEQTVSVVYHTAWNDNDSPAPREYPSYFFPTTAVLDERTVQRLPKRLRSLTVILDNMRHTGVEFIAGYNMLLNANTTVETDGGRRSTRVVFNASAGAGLGVFPDCTSNPLQITTLNGVLPTPNGDFFLAATGCYWLRQPTRVISEETQAAIPEINLTPGSIPTTGLPSPLAGTTKTAPGWPHEDDPRYAHLQIGNDCAPCVDCPDFVAAALYLNDTRDRYHRTGKQFEGARDLYHANRERWLSMAGCLNRRPLRLRLLPQLCPFLDVSVQFCNQGGDCQTNVELQVDFTTSPDGATATEVPGFTFITGARNKPGRVTPLTDRYNMGDAWPSFTAFFDVVQPGQSVHARFRLLFSDCGLDGNVPFAITGVLTATVNGNALMVQDPDIPTDLIAATTTDTQTLACPIGPNATINYLTCACET